MPFTLSHPAAVLPLARGPLVPAALVAGAVAPDVPYYLWPAYDGHPTHDTWAVLTLDVLLAAGVLALWYAALAPALVALAPPRGRVRTVLLRAARRPRVPQGRALAWVVLALALGAVTHVAWDAFTHADGQVAGRVAALREVWVADVPGYRVLQHASTALGMLVLLLWAGRCLSRVSPSDAGAPDDGTTPRRRALLRLLVALCGTGVAVLRGATGGASGPATEAVEGLVLGLVVGLVLVAADAGVRRSRP